MIQQNILKQLDVEERKIAIDLLPKHVVVEFIKKNSKKISEVKGLRLDTKSQRLLQMIPNILLKRVDQSDKVTTMFIDSVLEKKINGIYNNINEQVGKTEFVQSVFTDEKEESYGQVLELLMDRIEPDNIMVFLKLSGIDLKIEQQKALEKDINLLILKKELKEQIYEELNCLLQVRYKEEVRGLEENYRKSIRVQKSKYEEAKNRIKEQEANIKKGQERAQESERRCEQQQKEMVFLKKAIESLEDKYENKIKQLNKSLNDKEAFIEQLNIKNNVWAQVIKQKELHIEEIQQHLEVGYEEFSTQYLERWQIENQFLLNKKEKLAVEIKDLEKQHEEIKKSIQIIVSKKEEVEEKLSQYNEQVENFAENIDQKIIQSALEKSMINIKLKDATTHSLNQVKPYIKQAIQGQNIKHCDDIEVVSSNIAANFTQVGIRDKDEKFSDYIVSVIAARRVPLVVGYGARNIVRAISAACVGEMPAIISLPSGFNDVDEPINLYHTIEAKAVLIEGVIGQLNESAILPLLRDYTEDTENDKLLFVTCEDIDSIKFLPSYLLEYMALVQIENMRPRLSPQYNYSDGIKILEEFRSNVTNVDEEYIKMQRLLKGVKISLGYMMTRTMILAYIHRLRNIQKSLECLIIVEIKWIGQHYEIGDQIEENIISNKRDFSIELERTVVGG